MAHAHPPESIRIRFLQPDVAFVDVDSVSVAGQGTRTAADDRLGKLRKIGVAEAFGEPHQVNEAVNPEQGDQNPAHLYYAVRIFSSSAVPE